MKNKSITTEKIELPLANEIKQLIEQSKHKVALVVNAEITLLYWNIGKKINVEILKEKRAEYGKQIVATLSSELTFEYGRGWSKRQLHHCLRFAEIFPDIQIVHTLRTQLSWTHIRLIIPIENELKRMFYIEMCKFDSYRTKNWRI